MSEGGTISKGVRVVKDGSSQVNVYLNKRDASILYRILYSVGGDPEGARAMGMAKELFQGLTDAGVTLPKDVHNDSKSGIYLTGPRDVAEATLPKIGTLVKIIAPYRGASGPGPQVGMVGIVRGYYSGTHEDKVGVEWFGYTSGHSLYGRASGTATLNSRAGWFVPVDIIEEYKG